MSLIADMQKLASTAEALSKKAVSIKDEIVQLEKVVYTAERMIPELNGIYNDGVKLGYEYGSKSEDLGIDPKSDNKYNDFWDAINKVQQAAGVLESYVKKHK